MGVFVEGVAWRKFFGLIVPEYEAIVVVRSLDKGPPSSGWLGTRVRRLPQRQCSGDRAPFQPGRR
jgi:hypothetical protein